MRIKQSLRVLCLALALILALSSAALAVPNDTLILGNKAYSLQVLGTGNTALIEELIAAFIANGNTYVYKNLQGQLVNPSNQPVAASTIQAVTYKDTTGATTEYTANDGPAVGAAVTVTATAAQSSIQMGATTQITATPNPADATVTYQSSNDAVATVNGTGLVTAVAVGTANITVTAAKTGLTSGTTTVAITVTAVPTVGLTVNAAAATVQMGQTYQIVATATPADATVTYESSDRTKATVSATGLVTPVAVGTANITVNATKTGYTAATPVTVAITVAADTTPPTITGVTATNAKTIVVAYSEAMGASATTPGNYSIYCAATGAVTLVEAANGLNNDKIQASAAFTDSTNRTVKITIVDVGAASPGINGYPLNGLSDGSYKLYVTGAQDTAGNAIVPASNATFIGTTTPDASGANAVTAGYVRTSGRVTISMDKLVNEAVPADNKVQFQVGSNTASLVAADYAGGSFSGAATTALDFNLSAAGIAKVNALGTGAMSIVLSSGAFTDGALNSQGATLSATVTSGPTLQSVTYNEVTNTAVYTYDKTIDVSLITNFGSAGVAFQLCGVDIYDGSLAFTNTGDATTLTFVLSVAKARLVEAAMRADADGTMTASVSDDILTDLDGLTNKAASSTVNIVRGVGYTQDTTAAALGTVSFYQATNVLAIAFNDKMANNIADFVTLADIQLYQDDNGTAGLQTGAGGDTMIASFNDTDGPGGAGDAIVQGDISNAGGGPITVNTEANTVYIKDAAGTLLHTAINAAIGAGRDVYFRLASAGAMKDAQGNNIAAGSLRVTVINNNGLDSANTQAATVMNSVRSVTVGFKDAGNAAVQMDNTTTTNPANWTVHLSTNPLQTIAVSEVIMNPARTSATLILATPMTVGPAQYHIETSSAVKTAAGLDGVVNLVKTAAAAGAGGITAVGVTPVTTDVDGSGTLSATDTVAVTFSNEIVLASDFSIASITVNNGHTLGNSTYALSADKKTVTITLGTTSTAAIGDTLTFNVAKVKDLENNALAAGTTNAIPVPVGAAAPAITGAVFTDFVADGVVGVGDKLVLTFDQNLYNDPANPITGLAAADFASTAGTGFGTFTAAKTGDKEVTLTFTAAPDLNVAGAGTYMNGTMRVDYGVGAVPEIRNGWGLSVAPDGARAVAAPDPIVTAADTVAPKVTSLKYKASTHELTFVFDKTIQVGGTALTDVSKMLVGRIDSVSAGSTIGSAAAVAAAVSADKKEVTVTLTGETLDQYTTILLKAGDFNVDATAVPDGTFEFVVDAYGVFGVRGQGTSYTLTIVP